MVYSTKRFVVSLALYYFVLVLFSPFSIAMTSFGKRALTVVLFVHLFDLCLFFFFFFFFFFILFLFYFFFFVVVCFLFLLVSGKGCGLWDHWAHCGIFERK